MRHQCPCLYLCVHVALCCCPLTHPQTDASTHPPTPPIPQVTQYAENRSNVTVSRCRIAGEGQVELRFKDAVDPYSLQIIVFRITVCCRQGSSHEAWQHCLAGRRLGRRLASHFVAA
jgi:hypothetical protein